MDSVVIRCAFYVCCELVSEIEDQQYDFTMGIIRGSRRELLNLRFRFLQQILQFTREFRQPKVRWQ